MKITIAFDQYSPSNSSIITFEESNRQYWRNRIILIVIIDQNSVKNHSIMINKQIEIKFEESIVLTIRIFELKFYDNDLFSVWTE